VDQQKARRTRIFNLIKIAVSLGLLVLLLTRVDAGQALQRLAGMNFAPFLGAGALYVGGVLVRAYRWGVLIWSLGVRVPWRRLVALYFVGSFYNLVLPTGFGGDAVKMLELSRDSKPSSAISSVLVDRFSGLLVLFLLAALALVGSYQLVTPLVRLIIVAVALIALVAIGLLVQRTWLAGCGRRLRLHRLLDRFGILRELYASLHLYSPRALAQALAASLLFNLMHISANILLAAAVGIHLPVWYFVLFVPLIAFTAMLPSVGGLGLREGAYVLLFVQVGVDHEHALALALARDMTMLRSMSRKAPGRVGSADRQRVPPAPPSIRALSATHPERPLSAPIPSEFHAISTSPPYLCDMMMVPWVAAGDALGAICDVPWDNVASSTQALFCLLAGVLSRSSQAATTGHRLLGTPGAASTGSLE
jgi:uncharacterized protein (TIRG00374 family)